MGCSCSSSCCCDCWKSISVEPVLFLFSLSNGLSAIISQNLYIEKVCSVNLGYSMEEVCSNIFEHPEVQIEVQKYVSALQAYNGILQALPAVVYALFAGSWSDLHGRKSLIVFSCFGYIFNNLVYIICAHWWYELDAEYLLFECLQDCTGGYVCFFLGCYSYITDITTSKNRTKRLAFLDGLFPIGFFSGMALSSYIKSQLGYVAHFSLAMGCAMAAMLYAIIFLKDSRKLRPPQAMRELQDMSQINVQLPGEEKENVTNIASVGDQSSRCCKTNLSSFLDFGNVKRAFRTTFKRREYGMRQFILLLIFLFILEMFLIDARGPSMYLFLRKQFQWDAATFGQFLAFLGIIGLLTQYVAVPVLTGWVGLRDSTLAGVAMITVLGELIIWAFATEGWHIYAGGTIAGMSICITTTIRSNITKIVGPHEIGAVFSLIAASQAAVPLVARPLFGFTYRSTIDTFPGAFLLVAAVIAAFCTITLFYVTWGLQRADRRRKKAERATTKKALLLNTIE